MLISKSDLINLFKTHLRCTIKLQLVDHNKNIVTTYYSYLGKYISIGLYEEDQLTEPDVMEEIIKAIDDNTLEIYQSNFIGGHRIFHISKHTDEAFNWT